jgi:tRNA U34 5-carboxymethylaminomethyl modifying GTPase MnmE/TrmE
MYNAWAAQIVKSLAHVEAFIDFGEEESLDVSDLEISMRSL